MLRLLGRTSILLALLLGGTASAQIIDAQVEVSMPTPHFEVAPRLVVVRPGLMVVADHDEEIFFTGGWYWYRSGPDWYRTRSYRGGWVIAPRRAVPARLVRMPPGRYCHFRPGPGHPIYRPMHHRERRVLARGPHHGGHFGHGRGHR